MLLKCTVSLIERLFQTQDDHSPEVSARPASCSSSSVPAKREETLRWRVGNTLLSLAPPFLSSDDERFVADVIRDCGLS